MTEPVKIGKRTVDAMKAGPERCTVWDAKTAGVGVRIATTGNKTNVLRYRVGSGRTGRVRRATLGNHNVLAPDQARDTAKNWAAEVADGGRPCRGAPGQAQRPRGADDNSVPINPSERVASCSIQDARRKTSLVRTTGWGVGRDRGRKGLRALD